ncbi:MAG: ATP-binding protein, partial [Lachnospiraceae bacterium]|nr:ATP-binding protein [Lachnospiraceae bacterium]
AVFMVKQLASLFRISLSKGHTIISLGDEIRHAQYYMNIQKIRYKNDFQVSFDVDEELLDCCTVKLIIQPILENAIYYGMEYMDDEGEIRVTGRREGGDILIDISDNGPGMPEEKAAKLLTEPEQTRSSGSGVGLVNVHNRIRLRFGSCYGLEIAAFPDEGTRVRIHLPYIPFTQENRDMLEQARWRLAEAAKSAEENGIDDGVMR